MVVYMNDMCEGCAEEYEEGFIVEIKPFRMDHKGNIHYGCVHQTDAMDEEIIEKSEALCDMCKLNEHCQHNYDIECEEAKR